MLKKTVLWGVGFVSHLLSASIASTQGFNVIDPKTGEPVFIPPNRSAMWPPHRRQPTQKRLRKGRSPYAVRLVGAKGLRP